MDAAVNHRLAKADELAVGLKALADLDREFPRGGQHKSAGRSGDGGPAFGFELVQNRQGKRRRLAGAGLGGAEQIPAGQHMRNCLGLDRGGGGIILGPNRAFERFGELEFRERMGFQGDTWDFYGGPAPVTSQKLARTA